MPKLSYQKKKIPEQQKKTHVQKFPMPTKNSHVKEKFPSRNPHAQKFHTRTKNPCQKKFPQPKPTLPKLVHNQKSCAQKGQFPTNKKKKKKKPMPHQKFHHNQNFSHVHTQLPNLFSITTHKNFYMTKIANK